MMRRWRFGGAVLLLSLLAGCGGSGEAKPEVKETVVDTVRRYVVVLGDSDRARASARKPGSETTAVQPGPDTVARPVAKPLTDTGKAFTLNPQPSAETTITITGVVQRMDIEGGFWGIAGYDHRNYRPAEMPPIARRTGLVVKFNVRMRSGVGAGGKWGIPVEVLACEVLRR